MNRNWMVRVGAWTVTFAWICGSLWSPALASDWPMLGRDGTRNSVSTETGAPMDWSVELREGDQVIREPRGIRWSAPLGSETQSTPVVSDGLVWIGTNNQQLGPKTFAELHSVLKCFRVADGQLVYEYVSPRLGNSISVQLWDLLMGEVLYAIEAAP